jgi:hypothetical protein
MFAYGTPAQDPAFQRSPIQPSFSHYQLTWTDQFDARRIACCTSSSELAELRREICRAPGTHSVVVTIGAI